MKVLIVVALVLSVAQSHSANAQELVSDYTPGTAGSYFNSGAKIGDELFFTNSRYLLRLDSDGLTKVDSSKVDNGESFMRIIHQTDDKFWYVKLGPEGTIHDLTGDPLNLHVISREENQEGVIVDTLNYSNQSRGSYLLGESVFIFGYNRLLRKDVDDLHFYPIRIDDQEFGSRSFNEGHWVNGKLLLGISSNGPGNGVSSIHHEFFELDQSGVLLETMKTGTVNSFPFAFLESSLVVAKATSDGDDGICRSAILRHELNLAAPDTLVQFEEAGSSCASDEFLVPKLIGKRQLVPYDFSAFYQFRDLYYFVSDDTVQIVDERDVPIFFEDDWYVRSAESDLINGYHYFYFRHFEDRDSDGVADAIDTRVARRREGFSIEELFGPFRSETVLGSFPTHDFIYGTNVYGETPVVAGAELFLLGFGDLWHLVGDRFRSRTNFRSTNGAVEKILAATDDKLYFAARDDDHGSELWSVDLFVSPVANEKEIPDPDVPKLQVYPNPLTKGAEFSIESDRLIERVDVYDSLGRLVTSEVYSPSANILKSSSDFPRGIYFISAKVGEVLKHAKLVIR